MLYRRDFLFMTKDEITQLDTVRQRERTTEDGQPKAGNFHRNLFSEYPKAARHYLSMFPNNYLDQVELWQRQEELKHLIEKYKEQIDDPNLQELQMKAWIKENEAYHLIGSILSGYNFGHHDAYLFAEFPLGTSYQADYLLVGLNSDGYHFIFCEFESIWDNKKEVVAKRDGSFGGIIEKGISQINLWKSFLQSNFSSLENDFVKYKSPNSELTDEFRKYKPWQIYFVVVAGRRNHYNKRTRELRKQLKSEQNISLLHYDNLSDFLGERIGSSTY